MSLVQSCLNFQIGHRGAGFVNPPSGSLIANFEGAVNASTLICNVLNNNGLQTTTTWWIQNFRSQSGVLLISDNAFPDLFSFGGDPVRTDPTRTHLNQLTLLDFNSALDGATVFCGAAVDHQQANFSLRVYCKIISLTVMCIYM